MSSADVHLFLYFAAARACRDGRCDFEAGCILIKACNETAFLARILNIMLLEAELSRICFIPFSISIYAGFCVPK